MSIILKQFISGALENNNYLLVDKTTKEAVLIDCTEENPKIDKTIEELGAKLKYILLTHGHFDHILGVNYYREKYNAKSFVHENDMDLVKNVDKFMTMVGYGTGEIQTIDETLNIEEPIKFGESEIKTLHTPGHTQGCVGFYTNGYYFSGDTLFRECVGRTDLPGGDFEQLKKSVKKKIFSLPEETGVYPGHGPETTIEHEKKYNEFV